MDGLQAHLNRVVEENIRLKVGPPKTPTTPTSPLPVIKEPVDIRLKVGPPKTPTTPTSPLPVIKEPVDRKGATENNEEEPVDRKGATENNEVMAEMYAQVDYSKASLPGFFQF